MKTVYLAFILVYASSFASSQSDSLFTAISGDTVTIWNTGVKANCASRFGFSMITLDSNDIVLTEIDTVGPIARCNCSYNLSLVLIGWVGHYEVEISRQYLLKYGYPKDSTLYVGSTSFTAGNTGAPYSPLRLHQSDCLEQTSLHEEPRLLPGFALDLNYPNPFNPTTIIHFSIPHTSKVTLKIFDGLGREVKTLVDELKNPGSYNVSFNSQGLAASGVYFCRLTAGPFHQTRRMILVK